MDVQMPEMGGLRGDGARFARSSARRRARVPIVAMTAHAMKGDRERCLAAGMDEYLTKPLDPRQLCMLVEHVAAARWRRRAWTTRRSPASRSRCSRGSAATASSSRKSAGCSSRMRRGISSGIRAALDARDGGALRRAAHGLKGAAANFDADAVVSASRTLEEIGRTQPFDADHLSEAAWQSLADEIERLISLLKTLTT